MEIQALKLLLTEQDVNTIVAKALEREQQVRDVRVKLLTDGVHVSGLYPTAFMTVKFETLWSVAAEGGKVAARLADVKVIGLPAVMLRGMIMGALADATANGTGLMVDGEQILFDPDHLLASNGFTGRTNLTAVRSGTGTLLIEACAAPSK
jgi:hypothetical protein